MLSNYCFSITNNYDTKIGRVNKLVRNLGNEKKYVLQYRNLQMYLSLGTKLVKVHRNFEFKQSDWLKKYIDFNTDKIKNASYTGDYKKYVSKPTSVSQKVFDKILLLFMKPVSTVDKPIYAGFNVLDLRKLLMCLFHYKYIKTKQNITPSSCLQAQTV